MRLIAQAFTTSLTVCSSLRQKLLQTWSLKRISQSAGSNISTTKNTNQAQIRQEYTNIFLLQALPPSLKHPGDFRADCQEGKHQTQLSLKAITNVKVAEEAYQENTASTYPEPEDKEAFIRTHLYDYNYDKVSS